MTTGRSLLITRGWGVVRQVARGCYTDGFIHAGNLAYMAMLAIFPFFITSAAIFSLIGEESERVATISAILATMPPVVAEAIGPAARSAVNARSGTLLWVGGLVGLWTVGSLIETIRDILHRAYGVASQTPFWRYRLFSTGMIVGGVLVLLASLLAQVAIGTAQEIIRAWFPQLDAVLGQLAWSRIVPAMGLVGSLYFLFAALTPAPYRARRYAKWPGALLVSAWWLGVSLALPPLLSRVFTYHLTYGPLAGIMIALFFFWLVGLGVVAGAELNAALARNFGDETRRPEYADSPVGADD